MKNLRSIFTTFFQILVRPTFYLILKIFCRVEVHGAENLLSVKKVILAPNHICEFDPVTVGSCIPFRYLRYLPIFFTSLPSNYYKNKDRFGCRSYFYRQEWFFKMLGAYPVDKEKKNYEVSLKYHLEILNDGYSILMFPEGRMYKNGEKGKIRGGTAFASEKTNTPIVPVFIKISSEPSLKNFLLGKRKIKVFYGKPLLASDLLPDFNHIEKESRYREVMKKIMMDYRESII